MLRDVLDKTDKDIMDLTVGVGSLQILNGVSLGFFELEAAS